MKYHADLSDGKFAYLQLYEQFKKDITEGLLPFGAKLPSKRLLAEESGLSVITVEHAYAILRDEGYIESRQRSGFYVIYRERDFLSAAPAAHRFPEHTRISQKSKSSFPFSVISKTMRRVISDYGENILVKPHNRGCIELREAISSYLLRSSSISVSPEQIVIGSGAEYLYGLIVQLLGKDRIFALENPSYEKIGQVYRSNAVTCDMLDLTYDGIRSDELDRTEATVLHITPFNSYPSGITASVSKRREYLRWAKSRGGYIIEDNYASELTVSKKNDDTVFSMSREGRVIYLNTFSETIAPAVRVGYMLLPTELLHRFDEMLGFYSCTVPSFDQYVLAELIENGDFERHINRVRRQKRKNLTL